MLDWNDLRYFLAVADSGSTLAAGRLLRVSQTTAARRIAALEAQTGLKLFDRASSGYALTPAGEALLARARAVEGAAALFQAAAAAQSRDLCGVVRLSTVEIYAVTILTPILRDLHEAHPDIRIELDTDIHNRDLAAGEADIAFRIMKQGSPAGLVGRRIANDPWTVYCSTSYAATHGAPRKAAELRDHVLIGGGGSYVWPLYQAWLRRHDLEHKVVMHHDSAVGLLAAVRAGAGLAALPMLVADNEPGLVRCLEPRVGDSMELWLLTHERLRHTPRVRAVIDFLTPRLVALQGPRRGGPAAASST